ncbi:hypothetical protein M885DRAFT_585858 [Pelagophyceae sp. CCMP2097]|nr:hypothetical protein M885DRAFT_591850 [Pelagophyceae sp. CCMP2097]KAJ1459521.1 hypothetical protein M885DRAFT_585858 [Pelagophyceae sp. CCMP2097]
MAQSMLRRAAPLAASVAVQGAFFASTLAVPDAVRAEVPLPVVGLAGWALGAATFRAAAGPGRSALWYLAWCGPAGGGVACGLAALAAAVALQPKSPLDAGAHAAFDAALSACDVRGLSASAGSRLPSATVAHAWHEEVAPLLDASGTLTVASVAQHRPRSDHWLPLVRELKKRPQLLHACVAAARRLAARTREADGAAADGAAASAALLDFEAFAHVLLQLELAAEGDAAGTLAVAWALLASAPVAGPDAAAVECARAPAAAAAAPALADDAAPPYVAAAAFAGARPGYVFKAGAAGVGYYVDDFSWTKTAVRKPADLALRLGGRPRDDSDDVVTAEQLRWWIDVSRPFGAFDERHEAFITVDDGWFGQRARPSSDADVVAALLGGRAALSRSAEPAAALALATDLAKQLALALEAATGRPAHLQTPAYVVHAVIQQKIEHSFAPTRPAK